MDSLSSLTSTLPSRRRTNTSNGNNATHDLDAHEAFKHAALSVTKLYKAAAAEAQISRQEGYLDAVEDMLKLLDEKAGEGMEVERRLGVLREWCFVRRRRGEEEEEEEERAREEAEMEVVAAREREAARTQASTTPAPPSVPASEPSVRECEMERPSPLEEFNFTFSAPPPPQRASITPRPTPSTHNNNTPTIFRDQARNHDENSSDEETEYDANGGAGMKRRVVRDGMGGNWWDGAGPESKRGRFT
ncbi:hypothetical protein SAICODRAFT_29161 [Saitoella complicata NRRL Y-17804]|uniref:uncharacterized protein n=1 Tax=Saitoella complicata (strain BCRC 22490 / CBS 7301 / JCM 7358 / NBRC 10748 / NRRL Y-17804) TaxID=698492 RepID=UPI000867A96E|nr:uncharacterized protein SAICODRAFT_29161 [Saitoella complicata NRRL Y-17804]ODQ54941.1 hypothetical protein SAICODRAFT_29161 [Saitoella complicata NRRL Y-17804]